MKLKSLNCKNCGSPMREINGMLHCDMCGSDFSMEESQEAKTIDHMQQSVEKERASIETDKQSLEKFQMIKEQAQLEKEARNKAFFQKVRKEASRKAVVHTAIALAVSFAVIGLFVFLVANKDSKKKPKATTTTTVAKNYRVTPSELKEDPAFIRELTAKASNFEKEGRKGAVLESTSDTLYIWNLNGDPYVMEYFLLTRDDGNYLYMLMGIPMVGDDNGDPDSELIEREVYEMVYIEDVLIGPDGKITYYNDQLRGEGSSEYNFLWHADFDKDKLIEDVIGSKEKDPEKPYTLHRFSA